jgi:hypothetical protein
MADRSVEWSRTDQSSGQILTMWARGTSPPSRVRCKLANGPRACVLAAGQNLPLGHAGRSCLRQAAHGPCYRTGRAQTPERTVKRVRRQVADEPRHDRRIEERPAVAGRMRPEPERTRASRGDVRRCGQKDEVLERAGRVAGLPAESRVDPRRRSARVADGPDTAWRCLKASERQFAAGAPGLPVEIAAAMLIARWLAEAVAWRGAALVRGWRRSRRPASWRW